ncbi:unnamed protein product [Rotaria sordida]|uniref:Uncharacterized protein n=2 Tax=Rotaria sordida TaxID=392033 RepID=A0A819V552_9BILA|nr:unnamed protein product [Rotaria sordida]CAF4099462.1 unnamed protein product [Rotaria sordida]
MQQYPYHLSSSYSHPMDNMPSLLCSSPAPPFNPSFASPLNRPLAPPPGPPFNPPFASPLNRPLAPPPGHEQQHISTLDDILANIINTSTNISDPVQRQAMLNDTLYHEIFDEVKTPPSK